MVKFLACNVAGAAVCTSQAPVYSRKPLASCSRTFRPRANVETSLVAGNYRRYLKPQVQPTGSDFVGNCCVVAS